MPLPPPPGAAPAPSSASAAQLVTATAADAAEDAGAVAARLNALGLRANRRRAHRAALHLFLGAHAVAPAEARYQLSAANMLLRTELFAPLFDEDGFDFRAVSHAVEPLSPGHAFEP